MWLQHRQLGALERMATGFGELKMDPNRLETRWKTTVNGVSVVWTCTTIRTDPNESDADFMARHAQHCADDLDKHPIATS